jgi:hypothetical protein
MAKAKRKEKPCTCARCRGLKSAHPRWGYDRREVPRQECLICHKPIGRRRYMLFLMLARFGQMMVGHKACVAANDRKGWVEP